MIPTLVPPSTCPGASIQRSTGLGPSAVCSVLATVSRTFDVVEQLVHVSVIGRVDIRALLGVCGVAVHDVERR